MANCWLLCTPSEATISALSVLARRAGVNAEHMKKAREKNQAGVEYNFAGGVRGKYARRYAQGTNVVVLEPYVARVFPNAKVVNGSLRALAQIIRKQRSAAAK